MKALVGIIAFVSAGVISKMLPEDCFEKELVEGMQTATLIYLAFKTFGEVIKIIR